MNLVIAAAPASPQLSPGHLTVILLIVGIGYIVGVVALWKLFAKTDYPGWLALIPIVNLFTLVLIARLTVWWGLLFFVPVAGIVLHLIVALRVGKGFGRDAVFSVFLLWLLPIIGYFVIGFGRDTYDRGRIAGTPTAV